MAVAPSAYYQHQLLHVHPERRCARSHRDAELKAAITRIWQENYQVYGVCKVWEALVQEGQAVARCTVARLMRRLGLKGDVRGKTVRTTRPDAHAARPSDLVQRNFKASRPHQLWVADVTYVATWQGFAYTAFVIDAYSRKIVGWRVSSTLKTDLALDALEQALHACERTGPLIHHNDRGPHYVSITYSQRLAEAGIAASVGSKGDSYDNALAETINGLYKTELIHRKGPWRNLEAVEFETLKWVDWFNNRRLMGPIGYAPPSAYERAYFDALDTPAAVVGL